MPTLLNKKLFLSELLVDWLGYTFLDMLCDELYKNHQILSLPPKVAFGLTLFLIVLCFINTSIKRIKRLEAVINTQGLEIKEIKQELLDVKKQNNLLKQKQPLAANDMKNTYLMDILSLSIESKKLRNNIMHQLYKYPAQ